MTLPATARFSLALAFAATLAGAQPVTVSPDLQSGDAQAGMAVIVKYKPGRHETRARLRGRADRQLDAVGGVATKLTRRELEELSADPDVESIHPDYPVRSTAFNGKLDYGWMTATGIQSMTGSLPYDGTGVGIAVIDSGMDPNADFGTRLVYSKSFVSGDATTTDGYGHGMHVGGIAGGNGKNSMSGSNFYKVRGIAPNVKLINLRVLDDNGAGTDSTVIAAIDTAIKIKSTYNIRVINLSVGRPVMTSYRQDLLCQAVERAWAAGIVVVVAAGNEGRNNSAGTGGYGLITSPGNDPYVITVGAANTMGTPSRLDDRMTSYSSKGPTLGDHIVKPDLVAPGNGIASNRAYDVGLEFQFPMNLVPTTAFDSASYQTDYFQLSGTSMAAPMVSGAAALLVQKTPSLTPDQVKARLMKTASKTLKGPWAVADAASGAIFAVNSDIFTVGAGYLDVAAALASTDLATGSALSPTAVFNASNNTITVQNAVISGTSVIWGTNATWASSVIWGTNVNASSVIWGTGTLGSANAPAGGGVVWGSAGTASATSVIWGTSVVWGSSVIWGTNAVGGEATSVTLNGDN